MIATSRAQFIASSLPNAGILLERGPRRYRSQLAKQSPFHSSYERGCQVKKLLPAPLRDAGVVTYIQPYLIPHLILRGVIGLVALARRTFPRRCQPQLLVPTRRFHEVSGARRRSVPKLRKLKRWLKCQP